MTVVPRPTPMGSARGAPSAELRAELARFDAELPIAAAWTPPASWYTDPAFFELERCAVFTRSWQPVARVAELERPGSHTSGVLAGEPWVVLRGEDGLLRAFHNVCRHKGREVVQGRGCARELVCGYHAWTYGLDGRLKSAPRMAGIQDFDRTAMSLPALGVDVWGPWVFVHGDPGARPLRECVRELDTLLEAGGWSRLRFHGATSWTVECNWKVYVDNYLDGGYHIPHMHPSLDAQLDMRSYRTELFEEFSIQSSRPSAGTHGSDARQGFTTEQRIGERALYAWLFPNFMLNRYGPCLDTNHVVPLGPSRCRVDYEFWFEDAEGDEARAFVEASIEQSAVTQREDIAICESVQIGLGSSSYDRGRYAPLVELGEHHFHRLLAARLSPPASGSKEPPTRPGSGS